MCSIKDEDISPNTSWEKRKSIENETDVTSLFKKKQKSNNKNLNVQSDEICLIGSVKKERYSHDSNETAFEDGISEMSHDNSSSMKYRDHAQEKLITYDDGLDNEVEYCNFKKSKNKKRKCHEDSFLSQEVFSLYKNHENETRTSSENSNRENDDDMFSVKKKKKDKHISNGMILEENHHPIAFDDKDLKRKNKLKKETIPSPVIEETVGNDEVLAIKKEKKKKSKKESFMSPAVEESIENVDNNEAFVKKKKKKKKSKNELSMSTVIEESTENDENNKEAFVGKKKKKKKSKDNDNSTFPEEPITSPSNEKSISDLETYVKKKKRKKHKHNLKDSEHEDSVWSDDNSDIDLNVERFQNRKRKRTKPGKECSPSYDGINSEIFNGTSINKNTQSEDVVDESRSHRKKKKHKHKKVDLEENSVCSSVLDITVNNSKPSVSTSVTLHTEVENNISETEQDSEHSKKKKTQKQLAREEITVHLHPKDVVASNLDAHVENVIALHNESENETGNGDTVKGDKYRTKMKKEEKSVSADTTVSTDNSEHLNGSVKEDTHIDTESDMSTKCTVGVDEDEGNNSSSKSSIKSRKKKKNGQIVKDIVNNTTLNLSDLSDNLKALLDERKDAMQLTRLQSETLGSLCIMLPFEVPPIHNLETRVTGNKTTTQKMEIKAFGEKIKTGIYTKAEDEKIIANWSYFCKLHDLPPENVEPFLSFTTSSMLPATERIKFARFLAHGLDNRLVTSVYRRFRTLFQREIFKTGRFSAEEDEIITYYVNTFNSQTPFADLSKVLNRHKLAIEKRYITLTTPTKNHDYKWCNESDIQKFVKCLLEVTKLSNVEDLKDRTITSQEWERLSMNLDIPDYKLKKAWLNTIYHRIFIKNTIKADKIKGKLISKLIERDERDWRAIKWDEIAQDFEGFTGSKLNKMFKFMVRYYAPEIKDLHKCLRHLENNVLRHRKLKPGKFVKFKIEEDIQSENSDN